MQYFIEFNFHEHERYIHYKSRLGAYSLVIQPTDSINGLAVIVMLNIIKA